MDAVLKTELRDFGELINKMTGISNSFDYNHCIDMFERLVANGIPFEPEEIRDWLVVTEGLRPEDAKDVKTMAQKFKDGKTVRRR